MIIFKQIHEFFEFIFLFSKQSLTKAKFPLFYSIFVFPLVGFCINTLVLEMLSLLIQNNILNQLTSLSNHNLILKFFSGLLLAPFIEELLFRWYLTKIKKVWCLKLNYYLSSLIFGLLHYLNYKYIPENNKLILIIALPQIFSGLIFGFVRIKYGFRYCITTHSMYNFLFLIQL